jgi:hypothetical protein
MTARRRNLLVMVVMLLGASSASAIDPAVKCQSDKLRLAAKYTACRLEAEAEAAREFDTPDFGKCKDAYLSGWQKAEARARSRGTQCWTRDDAEAVEGDIDAHTGALAEWLGGGKP